MFFTPSIFSIFAIILGVLQPRLFMNFFRYATSAAVLTNEAAIKSKPIFEPNSRSFISLSER